MALGVALGLAAFAILTALGLLAIYIYVQMLDLILPGVSAGGIGLGGMTVEQAARKLDTAWDSGEGITLTDGQRTWTATPADFGLTLDATATARRAYEVGRGEGLIGEIVTLIESAAGGRSIAPVATLDPVTAHEGLTRLATTINVPPQDATIRIEGGQVVAVPGVNGLSLDVDSTLALLASDPSDVLAQGYLPLVVVPIAPRVSEADTALAEARQLLAAPLDLTIYDPISDERWQWMVAPEQIAAWLSVQTTESGPQVVVDEQRLSAYLSELSNGLGAGRYVDASRNIGAVQQALREHTPVILIANHPPTTYTVQPGDTLIRIAWQVGMPYWKLIEANPGIDENALVIGQTINVPSKDELLPLPVVPNKRIIISISEQHLWAYQDGQLVYDFVISTGIDRSPTQPGVFQIQSHELNAYASVWDLWMPHFMGIYEAWPGFMNGLHGLPTLSSGVRLWANVLGRPASYGCIILDLDDAETLYNWADDGVVVEIRE
jgi:LysM repeat protein